MQTDATKQPRQTQAAVMLEAETLDRALNAITQTTGLTTVPVRRELPKKGLRVDAQVRIKGKGLNIVLPVEVKRNLTTQTVGAALAQLGNIPGKAMLMADYVNPRIAQRLRELDIPFADAAGNIYLNFPPVLIYVVGNRPVEPAGKPAPTRAFLPAGLKVVFALLCKPELADGTYREIATAAGAALGTVGWVINDLTALGYLVEMGNRGRRLIDRQKLLNRWAAAYPEQLRPQCYKGRYTGPQAQWWQQAALPKGKAWWGGEIAAAKDTGYLKPARAVIYARGVMGEVLARNGLRTDAGGDTEVLEAFWDPMFDTNDDMAPPLVVYADLLAGGDPRNLETAELIYERHLARLIREN